LDIKSISQVEQEGGIAYFEQMAAPPADYVPPVEEGAAQESEAEPALVAAGDMAAESVDAADFSGAVATDESYESAEAYEQAPLDEAAEASAETDNEPPFESDEEA
jgi:hypothetical protein